MKRKTFNVGDAPLRVPQNAAKGGVGLQRSGRAPARSAKCCQRWRGFATFRTRPCAFRKMAGWAGRTGVRPLRKMYHFYIVKYIKESMREAKKGYCQLHFAVLQQLLFLLCSLLVQLVN